MPFTNYSYDTGLKALSDGVDSINKGFADQNKRQLLSALGQKLQSGDYSSALSDAAATGDFATLASIAKLAADQRQQQADRDYVAKGPDQFGSPSSSPGSSSGQSVLGDPNAQLPPRPMTGSLSALGAATVPNDENALPGTPGMNQTFADRLQDFQQDRGLTLSSGFRTPEQQATLYANRDSNPNPVAPQGSSMHERGLAGDLNNVKDSDISIAPQYGIQGLPGDRPHFQPSETFGNAAPDLNADPAVIALRQQLGETAPVQVAANGSSGANPGVATDADDPPVTVPGFPGQWTRAKAAQTDPNDTSTPDAGDVALAQKGGSGQAQGQVSGGERQFQMPNGTVLPESSIANNPRLKNMLSFYRNAPSAAVRERIKPDLDVAIADAKQQLETQQKKVSAPFAFQGGYFQKGANGKYEKVIDPDKDPTSVQEYEYAAKQARAAGLTPPPYNEWLLSTKKAGAQSITLDQRGENEFAKVGGSEIAKRFAKLSTEGDNATNNLALLGQLRDLGNVVQTGAPAAIQSWLANKGIKVGDNVGAVEAYSSIIDKLTPSQRVPGSGSTSDFEDRMFKNSLPKLLNTPEGNGIISNTLAAMAQAKLDRAKIAEQALSGELKPGEAIKQLRALPSPYENFKAYAKNGFKPGPGIDTTEYSPQSKQGSDSSGALNDARDAIARGAPRDAVMQRLRQNGIDPGGL